MPTDKILREKLEKLRKDISATSTALKIFLLLLVIALVVLAVLLLR